jgi:hypothetical protein
MHTRNVRRLKSPMPVITDPAKLVRDHGLEEAMRMATAIGATSHEIRSLRMAQAGLLADIQNPAFTYSAFSMTSLHNKRPENELDPWTKDSPQVTLTVKPGANPFFSGRDVDAPLVGVPFGPSARLVLIYLSTIAVRDNTRSIRLDGSMRQWIERMGFQSQGGRIYASVREQLLRIASCHLRFKWHTVAGHAWDDDKFIKSGFSFLINERDPRQPYMFEEEIILGETFYGELQKHAVPLDERAIRALSNNSVAMDAYIWLAFRLHHLDGPLHITWGDLHRQHGANYTRLRKFKEKFVDTMALVKGVYERAEFTLTDSGIILYPSPPPISPKLHVVPGVSYLE